VATSSLVQHRLKGNSGAIVGGALGGVILVAAVVILLLRYRSRKQARNAGALDGGIDSSFIDYGPTDAASMNPPNTYSTTTPIFDATALRSSMAGSQSRMSPPTEFTSAGDLVSVPPSANPEFPTSPASPPVLSPGPSSLTSDGYPTKPPPYSMDPRASLPTSSATFDPYASTTTAAVTSTLNATPEAPHATDVELTDEQVEFLRGLSECNVPAPAVARLMRSMMSPR
jgi:hypothetical protein